VAAALGIGVALYLQQWVRWPGFLAIGIGAVMAVGVLIIAASLEDDAEAADVAWRAASADIVERRAAADPEDTGNEPDADGPEAGSTGPATPAG